MHEKKTTQKRFISVVNQVWLRVMHSAHKQDHLEHKKSKNSTRQYNAIAIIKGGVRVNAD